MLHEKESAKKVILHIFGLYLFFWQREDWDIWQAWPKLYSLKDTNHMKLNLGCGKDTMEGYVNMDIVPLPWVDTLHDLEQLPYPFEDNTFEEIYCSHVLEHVADLTVTMRELVRIAKDGCLIKVKVPYFANPNGWSDPTHHRLFTSYTFDYFTKDCFYNEMDIEVVKRRIHFFSNIRYFISEIKNIIPDFFINLLPKIYERFFAFRFPAVEIHFLLRVKK